MRSKCAYFQRLNREFEIVNRTSWRCKMEYRIQGAVDIDVVCGVMFDKTKILISREMSNVTGIPRNQVIHCNDGVSLCEEAITQMRAEKTRATSDEYTHLNRPFEYIQISLNESTITQLGDICWFIR